MAEITLDKLAQQSGIEKEKLLKRIQQVDPSYQGETIDGKRAFDLVPGVRRQCEALTLHESMGLTRTLQSIAERPNETHIASSSTEQPATSHTARGFDDMSDDETLKQRARQEWNRDADLRAEFGGEYDSYLAYREAEAAGKVKVCGGGVKRGQDHV